MTEEIKPASNSTFTKGGVSYSADSFDMIEEVIFLKNISKEKALISKHDKLFFKNVNPDFYFSKHNEKEKTNDMK
jgi:hypothetical protein